MSDTTPRPKRPFDMSAEDVQELENHLVQNPDDLTARRTLILYAGMKSWNDPDAAETHLRHVLWVIQHHPESDLAGAPYIMPRGTNAEAIPEAQRLWRQQADTHPENAAVLGHAAQFLLHTAPEDWPTVEEWLRKAAALDPNNPEWPENLGRLQDFRRRGDRHENSKAYAQEALQHYTRAYELTDDEEEKILLLDELAWKALEAGEFEQASDYATRLIAGGEVCARGTHLWFPGNAHHWGYIVLGRVALHEGDSEAAKAHLVAAGQTKGSPQLNSYGPDVVLARALLEQGQFDTVMTYFKACADFWECGQQELARWVSALRQNRIPDFECDLKRR
jgi:tetratricopeptide (TPR) repeat protein